MSVPSGKSKEALKAELEHCQHIAQAYFGLDLNLFRLKGQIEEIVASKIADYYFQRFRDWSVGDLTAMMEVLAEAHSTIPDRGGLTAKQQLKQAKKAGHV